jgi:hypothetical protein
MNQLFGWNSKGLYSNQGQMQKKYLQYKCWLRSCTKYILPKRLCYTDAWLQGKMDHLNTRLVRDSDAHCSMVFRCLPLSAWIAQHSTNFNQLSIRLACYSMCLIHNACFRKIQNFCKFPDLIITHFEINY